MKYIDMTCTDILDGLRNLKREAELPDASESDVKYCELIDALIEGKGFEFMCYNDWRYMRRNDMHKLLKELIYAIETERITDRHTHTNIVTETLENLLDMYA